MRSAVLLLSLAASPLAFSQDADGNHRRAPPSIEWARRQLGELLDQLWTLPFSQWREKAAAVGAATAARAPGPERELHDAVQLLEAIETGGPLPEALPHDAGLLRDVRRGAMMPLADELAQGLTRLEPSADAAGRERMRLLAGAGPSVLGFLDASLARGQRAELPPELLDPICVALGRLGGAGQITSLERARYIVLPEMGAAAARASAQIDQRLRRGRQLQAICDVWSRVATEYPTNVAALISAANLAVVHDLEPAAALLERLRSLPVSESSALRDARAEASLGDAFRAIARGEGGRQAIEQALNDELSAYKRDRGGRELTARALFLRGLARFLGGDEAEARATFAKALKVAPYQPDQNQLDGVLWGSFGILRFLQRLADQDHAEQAVAAARVLLDVIGEHTQYYPGTDDGSEPDDRVRTSLPVTIAEWTLRNLARPEDVESILAPLVRMLIGSRYNSLLLAQCYVLQGDAQMGLGQAQTALGEYLAAEKIYREIEQEYLRDDLIDRDERLEPPLSAYRRVYDPSWYDNPWSTGFTTYRALIERRLANLEATMFQHEERAREHIRRAHDLDALDGDTRLLIAMSEARRGERERALRLLAVVEPLLDRLYNLACAHALASQPDQALDALERYLGETLRTEAARRMVRRLARTDPDLASLRDRPRFLALTQDG